MTTTRKDREVSVTRPQRRLLLAMFDAGARRVHHVNDLGSRLPAMLNLKRAGLVESTRADYRGLWRGRLSRLGLMLAKKLKHEDRK